jgi:hypothetical protein
MLDLVVPSELVFLHDSSDPCGTDRVEVVVALPRRDVDTDGEFFEVSEL